MQIYYNAMKVIRSFDCLIASLCVLLYFKFTEDIYDGYCNKCHKRVKSLFTKRLTNIISSQMSSAAQHHNI